MAVGLVGGSAKIQWFGDRVLGFVGREIDRKQLGVGHEWLTEAQRLAPVKTGKLRSELGFIYRQSDKTLQLYGDAPYELPVETGSRYMTARPHMRPALAAVARVWGGKTELAFPNMPPLVGTTRRPNPAVIAHNRAVTSKLNRGRLRKAKYKIGRGNWNGPSRPWES